MMRMQKKFLSLSLTGMMVLTSVAALADNNSTFGAAQAFQIAQGGSYSVVSVTASSSNNGSGGFPGYDGSDITLPAFGGGTTTFNPTSGVGADGSNGFGSTLSILAGIASQATTVQVRVRKPNDNEVFGYSQVPPLDNSAGYNSVLSDIFEITGIASPSNSISSGSSTQTDVFVIQMTYEGGTYLEDYVYEYGHTASWTEADVVANRKIHVSFYDPDSGFYSDEDLGNFNTGSTVVENYAGSYASFVAANGNFAEADLPNYLGSWGVDQVNNHVWAIIDHTTEFTVLPEPASLILFGIGGLAMLGRRR